MPAAVNAFQTTWGGRLSLCVFRFFCLHFSQISILTSAVPQTGAKAQSSGVCDGYARDYAARNTRGTVARGAGRGAIGGALIGGIVGRGKGAGRGALIGGGVGAVAGSARRSSDYNALYNRAYNDCMRRRR